MSPNKMPKSFSIFKASKVQQLGVVIALTLLFFGCGPDRRFEHVGQPFVLSPTQTMSMQDLDTQYRRYIKTRQPVRVVGTVKYQCQIRGEWAFIEQDDRLVFIDFASSSPNILLSTKKVAYPLIVEGTVVADDTVLNKYHIVPTGFEYQR